MGKLSYINDKLRMQTLWQFSHCLVYAEWLSHWVDSTADFYHATRMHSADYAVAKCPSVRSSVGPSVTRRYCV